MNLCSLWRIVLYCVSSKSYPVFSLVSPSLNQFHSDLACSSLSIILFTKGKTVNLPPLSGLGTGNTTTELLDLPNDHADPEWSCPEDGTLPENWIVDTPTGLSVNRVEAVLCCRGCVLLYLGVIFYKWHNLRSLEGIEINEWEVLSSSEKDNQFNLSDDSAMSNAFCWFPSTLNFAFH